MCKYKMRLIAVVVDFLVFKSVLLSPCFALNTINDSQINVTSNVKCECRKLFISMFGTYTFYIATIFF